MPKQRFYAVREGRIPGVYTSITECDMQVKGFPGAVCKKFPTLELANKFMNEGFSEKPMLCATVSKRTEMSVSEAEVIDLVSDSDSDDDIVITSSSDITSVSKITSSNTLHESYYAVRRGKKPGVYKTSAECYQQIKDFNNAAFRKFTTEKEALEYVRTGGIQQGTKRKLQDLVSNIPAVKKRRLGAVDDCESSTNNPEKPVVVLTDDDRSRNGKRRSRSGIRVNASMPKLTCPKPSNGSYYAVHRGKKPGVYKTWTECFQQVEDFRNASYRKFSTEEEALEYVRTGGIRKATKRELEDIDCNNQVIKKRRLGAVDECEYIFKNPEEPIVVFTDGSTYRNGRKNSRAGIGVYWGKNHPLNTSKRISGRSTNNRAEIFAAVHALNQVKQIGGRKVKLYTDSQFVIHAMTDWIKKWKRNGWKLVTGKEVVNKEDFIALDNAQKGLDVEWIYVKAHAKNKGNDEADKLAVAGSKLPLEPTNCSEFET